MSVINIILSTDLPTRAQNKLRYAIELGIWRKRLHKAEADKDYDLIDRLQLDYERVDLP